MSKLTKKVIDSSLPKEKDYIVWDNEIKGFGCRIFPRGKKTYVFYYRAPVTRKFSYIKVGLHGNLTVDEARIKAKTLALSVSNGIDVKTEKKQEIIEEQKSILFLDFWKIFTEKYIKVHHKESTQRGHKSRINKDILPYFGSKKIANIKRQDILDFKDSLSHVKGNCTKCLILLSTAFEQAELWGYRNENSNPCKKVSKYPDKKMQNYLSDDELETLERVLADYATRKYISKYTIPAIRLLIYTGCRSGEVRKLQWKEVDLKNDCLRLGDSKVGIRVIPLNDNAKEIILDIGKEKKEGNPYVFCGEKPGDHLKTLQKTWERIQKKAGISDTRIHDLRHSFASFAINNADLDLIHVQKLLGHKDIRTTLRYAHLTDKKLRDSTNKIFKTQNKAALNVA